MTTRGNSLEFVKPELFKMLSRLVHERQETSPPLSKVDVSIIMAFSIHDDLIHN